MYLKGVHHKPIKKLWPVNETPTNTADPPPEAKTANQAGIDGAIQAGGNTARSSGKWWGEVLNWRFAAVPCLRGLWKAVRGYADLFPHIKT